MRGHESITKILLSHGANVKSKGGLYGTALQAAAHRGHQKIVEILLDAGADMYEDGFAQDALHAASEGGHEKIVRFLLERGFKFCEKTFFRSHACPSRSDPDRNLLREASPSRLQETKPPWDHQPEPEDWHERASVTEFSQVINKLRGAVSRELELIQPYHERHARRDEYEETYALRAAAANGHATVVELLLNELDPRDISKEIDAAFVEACKNGHDNVVSLLLSDKPKLRVTRAALSAAALKGHIRVANLFIDHEDRLGLARVETVGVSRLTARDSRTQVSWFTYFAAPID